MSEFMSGRNFSASLNFFQLFVGFPDTAAIIFVSLSYHGRVDAKMQMPSSFAIFAKFIFKILKNK